MYLNCTPQKLWANYLIIGHYQGLAFKMLTPGPVYFITHGSRTNSTHYVANERTGLLITPRAVLCCYSRK
jgi:hypothetical protein